MQKGSQKCAVCNTRQHNQNEHSPTVPLDQEYRAPPVKTSFFCCTLYNTTKVRCLLLCDDWKRCCKFASRMCPAVSSSKADMSWCCSGTLATHCEVQTMPTCGSANFDCAKVRKAKCRPEHALISHCDRVQMLRDGQRASFKVLLYWNLP